jgi:hypothetical protein
MPARGLTIKMVHCVKQVGICEEWRSLLMHIHNAYTQTDERKKCNRTKTLFYLAHVRTSVRLGLDVRVSAQRVLQSERGYV